MAPRATPPTLTTLAGTAADRKAFDELFEHYAPRLMAFFLRRGENAQAAEELVQEVMLTVWSKAAMYDPGRASSSTWIYAIARNKHLDRLRQRRPEPDPEDVFWEGSAPPETPDEGAAANRRRERLRQALSTLPADLRRLLFALYFDGKSMSDVATETGVPLGTIKTRARKALASLRAAAAKDEET